MAQKQNDLCSNPILLLWPFESCSCIEGTRNADRRNVSVLGEVGHLAGTAVVWNQTQVKRVYNWVSLQAPPSCCWKLVTCIKAHTVHFLTCTEFHYVPFSTMMNNMRKTGNVSLAHSAWQWAAELWSLCCGQAVPSALAVQSSWGFCSPKPGHHELRAALVQDAEHLKLQYMFRNCSGLGNSLLFFGGGISFVNGISLVNGFSALTCALRLPVWVGQSGCFFDQCLCTA